MRATALFQRHFQVYLHLCMLAPENGLKCVWCCCWCHFRQCVDCIALTMTNHYDFKSNIGLQCDRACTYHGGKRLQIKIHNMDGYSLKLT